MEKAKKLEKQENSYKNRNRKKKNRKIIKLGQGHYMFALNETWESILESQDPMAFP